MESFTFDFPITVQFGRGTSGEVGTIAKSKGWSKGLIVTDEGIVAAGLLDRVQDALVTAGIDSAVYDDVEPNPTIGMVHQAVDRLNDNECDFVVGLGGGSSLDVAKTAAMIATNQGEIADYEVKTPDDVAKGMIEDHPLPLITIPTTAGTGSEVDFWAVITDPDRDFKMALGQSPLRPDGPYLGATAALVDPAMTESLPPRQTAATGFDALSHALENFVSDTCPPIVKPLAQQVLGIVPEYLPRAYEDGDAEARDKMMYAAHVAGIAENFAGFGAIHSLAEVTGGMYPDIPHGEAIAIYTPSVMRYNSTEVPGRYRDAAAAMGVDVEGLSDADAAEKGIEFVEDLIQSVDLPTHLADMGVSEEDLQPIAEKSLETFEIHDNPRKASAEDLLTIAQNSY